MKIPLKLISIQQARLLLNKVYKVKNEDYSFVFLQRYLFFTHCKRIHVTD